MSNPRTMPLAKPRVRARVESAVLELLENAEDDA